MQKRLNATLRLGGFHFTPPRMVEKDDPEGGTKLVRASRPRLELELVHEGGRADAISHFVGSVGGDLLACRINAGAERAGDDETLWVGIATLGRSSWKPPSVASDPDAERGFPRVSVRLVVEHDSPDELMRLAAFRMLLADDDVDEASVELAPYQDDLPFPEAGDPRSAEPGRVRRALEAAERSAAGAEGEAKAPAKRKKAAARKSKTRRKAGASSSSAAAD